MPEIRITISKVDENGKKAPTNKDKVKGEEKTSDTLQQAARTALVNAGKQLASYGLNQFGNLTGNKALSTQLDNITTFVGYAGQIAAGGLVGAAAVGVQIGIGAMNTYISNTRANQEANLLLQRSGNASLNGGRLGSGGL